MEHFPTPNEKPVTQITSEEVKKFATMQTDSPELHSWMEEKGIAFDQGSIEIEVDGKKAMMETSKDDFGTFSYPEN